MRFVRVPSQNVLLPAAMVTAGLLAAVACFSPGPVAGALLLTAVCIVAAATCRQTRRLARSLRSEAEQHARTVTILQTAEDLAGYGRWCIELESRRHLWSAEMCKLIGLPDGTPPDEGLLRQLMPAGMEQLEIVIASHCADREPFTIEFETAPPDAEPRVLRARARNFFSPEGGREQVFMVVSDVTPEYRLRRDRDDAVTRAEQAQKQADSDALTGLASRRAVMAELDRAVVRAHGEEEPLSLVVFDVDHFKSVNDRHGHPAGDAVLARIGEIAARHARERDTIGRIGGEEFLWILPGCDARCAMRAAERLRWAVEAGTHSAPIPSVTISAGHAQLSGSEAGLMLFARADEALYAAKRNGRNKVGRAA